jgi:RNA polymerase sigma factor (sigma-70 family)
MTRPATPAVDNPTLAAQMRPALLKYFRRKTGNTAEAEDLAQDVLVNAFAHADWASPEQAKGYIFRAAVNRWHDYLRRRRTHGIPVNFDATAEREWGVESPPERVLVAREELHRVAQVLDSLSDRTRTVLMLIRFEHMKAASVADMLGISVSAVNKHLASALVALSAGRDKGDTT